MNQEERIYPEPETYDPPVSALLTVGEPDGSSPWPLYPRLYRLTLEDVPELVRMVLDEGLNWADSDSLEVWAPVHAWRALGQLQAETAIPGLMAAIKLIDENEEPGWAQDELPQVLAMIGAAAIPHLQTYLADTHNGQWSRLTAADALVAIARKNPNTRPNCLNALTQQLALHQSQDRTFNAFLISSLLDLDAVEVAEVLKAAFTAGSVDVSIAGDWEEVQIELGLRHHRSTPRPQYGWLSEEMKPFAKQLEGLKQTLSGWEENRLPLPKVGRNDPCPCGSGLKYKKCHGKPGGK